MEAYILVDKEAENTQENEIRVKVDGQVSKYLRYAFRVLNKQDCNSLTIRAMGNAIVKALILIELVKRRIGNLHQVNKIYSEQKTDEYRPKYIGMDSIFQTRLVTALDCELSKEPLDSTQVGYQVPEPMETRPAQPYNKAHRQKKAEGGAASMNKGSGRGKREQTRTDDPAVSVKEDHQPGKRGGRGRGGDRPPRDGPERTRGVDGEKRGGRGRGFHNDYPEGNRGRGRPRGDDSSFRGRGGIVRGRGERPQRRYSNDDFTHNPGRYDRGTDRPRGRGERRFDNDENRTYGGRGRGTYEGDRGRGNYEERRGRGTYEGGRGRGQTNYEDRPYRANRERPYHAEGEEPRYENRGRGYQGGRGSYRGDRGRPYQDREEQHDRYDTEAKEDQPEKGTYNGGGQSYRGGAEGRGRGARTYDHDREQKYEGGGDRPQFRGGYRARPYYPDRAEKDERHEEDGEQKPRRHEEDGEQREQRTRGGDGGGYRGAYRGDRGSYRGRGDGSFRGGEGRGERGGYRGDRGSYRGRGEGSYRGRGEGGGYQGYRERQDYGTEERRGGYQGHNYQRDFVPRGGYHERRTNNYDEDRQDYRAPRTPYAEVETAPTIVRGGTRGRGGRGGTLDGSSSDVHENTEAGSGFIQEDAQHSHSNFNHGSYIPSSQRGGHRTHEPDHQQIEDTDYYQEVPAYSHPRENHYGGGEYRPRGRGGYSGGGYQQAQQQNYRDDFHVQPHYQNNRQDFTASAEYVPSYIGGNKRGRGDSFTGGRTFEYNGPAAADVVDHYGERYEQADAHGQQHSQPHYGSTAATGDEGYTQHRGGGRGDRGSFQMRGRGGYRGGDRGGVRRGGEDRGNEDGNFEGMSHPHTSSQQENENTQTNY